MWDLPILRKIYIERRWRAILAMRWDNRSGNEVLHWDDLPSLIRLAAQRPEFRRLLPLTSMHRFFVTPTGPVRTNSIPVVWPQGDQRYTLAPFWRGEPFAVGDAKVVLDALVERLNRIERL